jgi:hypothetical protein
VLFASACFDVATIDAFYHGIHSKISRFVIAFDIQCKARVANPRSRPYSKAPEEVIAIYFAAVGGIVFEPLENYAVGLAEFAAGGIFVESYAVVAVVPVGVRTLVLFSGIAFRSAP